VRPAPGVISHHGRMGSKTGTRGFSPWSKGGSVAVELTEIGEMRRWRFELTGELIGVRRRPNGGGRERDGVW
jgi:hypothetical protein